MSEELISSAALAVELDVLRSIGDIWRDPKLNKRERLRAARRTWREYEKNSPADRPMIGQCCILSDRMQHI